MHLRKHPTVAALLVWLLLSLLLAGQRAEVTPTRVLAQGNEGSQIYLPLIRGGNTPNATPAPDATPIRYGSASGRRKRSTTCRRRRRSWRPRRSA